jgi:hypothetical protein
MLKNAFQQYINFKGFSEKSDTAIITFYQSGRNDGLAFFSKYLREDLQFTYGEVGWIMVAWFGSMLGSWLGGNYLIKWFL